MTAVVLAAILTLVPVSSEVIESGKLGGGRGIHPNDIASVTSTGTATWYCGRGQRGTSYCTAGYGPQDLVAAIDRKDTPWEKGDRLLVTSGSRSVVVRIVDVCACKGRRLIDLSSGAFRRLAPLGRGVIPVTLTEVGSVRLPATDAQTPYQWREHR